MANRLIALAHARAVLAIAAAMATSACVDVRSDEFRCASNSDCEAPRTCEANWCVLDVADAPDATPPRTGIDCTRDNACPESIACAPGQPCAINCGGERSCGGEIVCAAGQPCTIFCDGRESCRGGIDCGAASECNLVCAGEKACTQGMYTCGNASAPCTIDCSGKDSCEAAVDCSASCGCDVACTGSGRRTCDPAPMCPAGCERADGPGCDGSAVGCNTCP